MADTSSEISESCIEKIEDYIELIESVSKKNENFWYRGHRKAHWPLLPSVFRDNVNPSGAKVFEPSVCQNFRLRAPARYSRCPNRDDHPSWLFLMQHYGCPTRLLDWTKTPLVALYFSLILQDSKTSDDGAVWVLAPRRLNEETFGNRSFRPAHSSGVHELFAEAFKNRKDPDPKKPIAVHPEQIDLRMLVQDGNFTVHSDSTPLEDMENSKYFLRKILIPAESKKKIKRQLDLMNVKKSVLFPDLQALSDELGSAE